MVSVLDLGEQPLSNELVLEATTPPDVFPLHLRMCPRCGLGQVGEYVLPDRIFGADYPYLSSTSTSWVEHAKRYAEEIRLLLGLKEGDLVMEVASNDGYLLSAFAEAGQKVLGIEPATNVAEIAVRSGVPTINEFFGTSLAQQIVREHGHPRLVAANNVMAHVPDLHDFVGGFAELCGPDTLITVENPSLINLFHEAQFDTIYHEHFCYLTATSVQNVAASHGLELVRVEQFATHGGSNRYFLRRAGTTSLDDSVTKTLDEERAAGLFDPEVWKRFADASWASIDEVGTWLSERQAEGSTVAGYGAAAKGNTLLNAVGAPARHLLYVVDGSPAKQGKFLPGPQTPVLAPEHLAVEPVDHVLVLPWNLASEISPLIHRLNPAASAWVTRPRLDRLP